MRRQERASRPGGILPRNQNSGKSPLVRVAAHQPYFLPWLGYLNKLVHVQIFVLLDDVQFRKRHYYERTRITDMQGNIRWLGLPVGENFARPCNEVVLKIDCAERIIRTLMHSYARARHFEESFGALSEILRDIVRPQRRVSDINIDLVVRILELLDIRVPEIVRSSELSAPADATGRLIHICRELGADQLLLGSGKSEEVHDMGLIHSAGISVVRQNFLEHHPVYYQTRRRRAGFQRGLSCVDAILNTGRPATREMVNSVPVEPFGLDERKA
ncbi:WbqC family protein [Streptomyces carminius]|uniref:WbqC family protein n=1 Tax=Streptomyces carminius TaxID=2665496 RepID=UPI0022B92BCB|nr:WbqC family protein [Streptomyces carminius]